MGCQHTKQCKSQEYFKNKWTVLAEIRKEIPHLLFVCAVKIRIQLPSEYGTSLLFKWYICVRYSKGGLKTRLKKPVNMSKMSGIRMVHHVT